MKRVVACLVLAVAVAGCGPSFAETQETRQMCSALDQERERTQNLANYSASLNFKVPRTVSHEVHGGADFISMGCDQALAGCRRTQKRETTQPLQGYGDWHEIVSDIEWFCDGEFIAPCEQIGPIDFETLEQTWVCP